MAEATTFREAVRRTATELSGKVAVEYDRDASLYCARISLPFDGRFPVSKECDPIKVRGTTASIHLTLGFFNRVKAGTLGAMGTLTSVKIFAKTQNDLAVAFIEAFNLYL